MDELLDVLKHAIVDTLRGERWGEALPMLEECCERFPEDTRSWLNRGYCLVRLGRYQEAVAAFNRCLGLDPNLEKARKWRDRVVTEPLLFLKPPSAVIGHGSEIILSELSRQVEHEAELALVIGRRCRSIAPERAWHSVLGVICANDVTARDLQRADAQWTRGKGFDTFCPLRP